MDKHTVKILINLGAIVITGIAARKRKRIEHSSSDARAKYMLSVLERHDIELDEFDIIALNEL